jgi:polygalacturonase
MTGILYRLLPVLLLGLASTAGIQAQDTRTVKEPVTPPVCDTLKAALTNAIATSGGVEAGSNRAGSDLAGLDTIRIQRALDRCDKGKAVELAADGAKTAFLSGPLQFRAGVALLIDKGVTLYASRNPESYATSPGSCGVVSDAPNGCKPFIAVKGASGAGVFGEGAIDGQGGSPLIADGKASSQSWWDVAESAPKGTNAQVPRLIDTDLSDDLTFYGITLRNSPGLHISFHRGEGLTLWGVKIDTPHAARNTDGIDAEQAKNITITQSSLRTGGDNVDLNASDGPTTNVSLLHNHFYWGRGMSIGNDTTGGISDIRVDDLTLDGTDSGLRITSAPGHGGLVDKVFYNDVCIRASKSPVFFDTSFAFPGRGATLMPEYHNITLQDVRIAGGGRIQLAGYDNTHRLTALLDGVMLLDNPRFYSVQAIHADLTLGIRPVNLVLVGDDATQTGKPAKGSLPGCFDKFVPFPQ